MRKSILFLLITIGTLHSYAQKFDIVDFDQKARVAEWLYEYDMIAWWTSDSVMTEDTTEIARLGSEWFCFKDESNCWQAFYGKDVNGKFQSIFHYEVDTTDSFHRSFTSVDTAILNSYSRALVNASKEMELLQDTVNTRFNQYLRKNVNDEIEVWILPAFQPNGTAVFGGEFHYVFSSNGNDLITQDNYYEGKFRGFKVGEPREIWLDYRDVDKPTLGAIFFVWYYKKYFTKINIETSKSISTLFESDGEYNWAHVEKNLSKTKKRKKRKK